MPVSRFYEGWSAFNDNMVAIIAPLDTAQLGLRSGPDQRRIWFLAAHIVATRVSWFHEWMFEGPASLMAPAVWDDDDAPARTSEELVHGLRETWAMIDGCLHRWTPELLDETFLHPRNPREPRSRQWITWHVIEHDLVHGGELALTLGMHGLAVPDW